MSKLKVLLLMLFVSLFFACKSAPKSDKPEQPAEEEKTEQVVQEQSKATEEVPAAQPAESEESRQKREAVSYTVYFAPRASEIDSFTANKLDDIADSLTNQNVKKIIIYGHSAKLNSKNDEERIAFQRATAVGQYLQTKGFAAEDITVETKGAETPDGRHSEITDRFKNRRVEIRSAEQH